MHRAAPEFRQSFALNLDVFDVLRVFRWLDGFNHAVERDRNGGLCARVDADLFWFAIEITGRTVPLLAFAAIHWQFDGVTVGAFKGLITMKQRLDRVLAGFYVTQTAHWITEGVLVQCLRLAGFP